MNKEIRTRKLLNKISDPATRRKMIAEFQKIVTTTNGKARIDAIQKLATDVKKF